MAKIVFYALFLIVLQMAFGVFGTNPISDLLEGVIAYLPKVIAAILIIVIASAIAAAARELIDASLGGLSYGTTLANATGIAIVVVGIFAALNQLQIAPAIVNGLFYALLAIIVGSAVIAIGGGGIGPMRSRWENVLAKYDEEKPKLQQAAQGSKDRIAERAQQRTDQARSATGRRPAAPPAASAPTDPLLPPRRPSDPRPQGDPTCPHPPPGLAAPRAASANRSAGCPGCCCSILALVIALVVLVVVAQRRRRRRRPPPPTADARRHTNPSPPDPTHQQGEPMTDIETSPVSDLTGRTVIDPDGDKIGTVFDVYIDNATDQPEWLAITTGLFGTKVSFVPIAGAAFAGDDLQLGYAKGLVKDAPNADADGQLSPDEEAALLRPLRPQRRHRRRRRRHLTRPARVPATTRAAPRPTTHDPLRRGARRLQAHPGRWQGPAAQVDRD